MKYWVKYLVPLVLPVLVWGCASPKTLHVGYGSWFTLAVDQRAIVNARDKGVLRFVKVEKDTRSRRQGRHSGTFQNAVLLMEWTEAGGEPRLFRLNTHESYPREVVVGRVTVSLVSLDPGYYHLPYDPLRIGDDDPLRVPEYEVVDFDDYRVTVQVDWP